MTFETELRDFTRVLSEMAHSLESIDDAAARIDRVLKLANQIVPYRRCAVLEVDADRPTRLYVVPATDAPERTRLEERLWHVYRLLAEPGNISRTGDVSRSLSLPVIGLDSIVGVIRVEPSADAYDVIHLRILAIVAAQLGAYMTTQRLRETDRKRVEELAAAHEFQQRLAGIVSHDLRSPLAVISAVASNLLEQTTDEKQVVALQRALRNAEHATRLICDLLDATESRVSGTMRISPTALDVVTTVEDAVEDLRNAYPKHALEVVSDVDRSTSALWDRDRIRQVITNLVSNAIAHGAHDLPVRVTLKSTDDAVTIIVHNHGTTIPDELRSSIFDPFHHGARRPRPGPSRGLGLGLYIVAQIVSAHGGHIDVTSTASAGTAFTVHLPRRSLRSVHPEVIDSHVSDVVMVVDDDPEVRLGLSALLAKRGYRVVGAGDGVEALDLLRSGLRPKLLLLDLVMPRMDGATLWEHCKADAALASIPVVVISADAAAAVKIDRAKAVFPKPLSIDRLLATLRELE